MINIEYVENHKHHNIFAKTKGKRQKQKTKGFCPFQIKEFHAVGRRINDLWTK